MVSQELRSSSLPPALVCLGYNIIVLFSSKVSTDLVRSTRPVQPNTELSSQQEKKGKKKKKISLPVRLTEDRMTTSLHADHKIKAERKRSVDNLNLLSPRLGFVFYLSFVFPFWIAELRSAIP